MTEEIKAATEAAKRASEEAAARGDPAATPVPSTVPYEQRRLAIMGALGWDESRETVVQRCKEILTAADVAIPTLAPMVNRQEKGSSVELYYSSAHELQRARVSVRALARRYEGARGPVWLDAKKERWELKAARAIHRAADMAEMEEKNMQAPRWDARWRS